MGYAVCFDKMARAVCFDKMCEFVNAHVTSIHLSKPHLYNKVLLM